MDISSRIRPKEVSSIKKEHNNSWWVAILFLVVTFVCYLPGVQGDFVFDDITGIVRKEAIHTPTSLHQIWQANPSRFLANLSFAANYRWGANAPVGYHLVNIGIHAAVGIVVYGWLLELTRRRRLSLLVALIFLIHPIQTQAVAYISQRTTALAAFWYLSSVWAWTRWLRKGGRRQDSWLIGLALVSAVASLLTKEYAYTLPLTVVLITLYRPLDLPSLAKKRVMLAQGGFFLLTGLVYLLARTNLFSQGLSSPLFPSAPVDVTQSSISAGTYFLTQGRVLVRYIGLLLLPVGQTVDHALSFSVSPDVWGIGGWLLIAGFAFLAVRIRRAAPLVSFGILFFLLTIAAESSIFPIADAMMEHRLYLPSLGLFLAGVAGWEEMRIRDYIRPAVWYLGCGVMLVAYVIATNRRVAIWQSSISLWEEVVRKSPQSARGHFNFGGALLAAGESSLGLSELQTAARINPSLRPSVALIRQLLEKQGNH